MAGVWSERPLAGTRIIEFAGIGPGPFAAMLLDQMGADVTRIKRPGTGAHRQPGRHDYLNTGRSTIELDLKSPEGRARALTLLESADALIEGFRPGVMERLLLGPEECFAVQPALVYGRMTGWGQSGPLASRAEHDINYIGLSGALHAIGPRDGPPSIPLNLIGDFGGGALYLCMGILAAMLHARQTGVGTVVDAAMVDGAMSLMTMFYGFAADGSWANQRGENRLDGGHPCYNVYETSDGGFMAVGALEPQFYAAFLSGLGLRAEGMADVSDQRNWPLLRAQFAEIFLTRTRQGWEGVFSDVDACTTPVLSMAEAPDHPHNVSRANFEFADGAWRPGPAPRFSVR